MLAFINKHFREYKYLFQVYNFFKKEELDYNLPLYKKFGIKKKYYSPISSEDFLLKFGDKTEQNIPPSIEDLEKSPVFQSLSSKTQDSIKDWDKNGYAILEKFYNDNEVDEINNEVNHLIESKQRSLQNGKKMMFGIHKSKILNNAGNKKELKQILELLLGKEIYLFQSINFTKGSDSGTHSDSYHMSTYPFGNIIAVWIALEDIGIEQGPLHYYPKSHHLPYVFNRTFGNQGSKYKLGDKTYNDYLSKIKELVIQTDLSKKVFLAKKGDLLIWHANLLHGAEKQTDNTASRKSMVFHYYAKDVICYHEVSQRPTLKKKK